MVWAAIKVTEEVKRSVLGVYAAVYETMKKAHPRMGETFEEWMDLNNIRPLSQWAAAKNSLGEGTLLAIHGVSEQDSVLFVYDPSGKLVGSFLEHHGQDRGEIRRKRVSDLLGSKGVEKFFK